MMLNNDDFIDYMIVRHARCATVNIRAAVTLLVLLPLAPRCRNIGTADCVDNNACRHPTAGFWTLKPYLVGAYCCLRLVLLLRCCVITWSVSLVPNHCAVCVLLIVRPD